MNQSTQEVLRYLAGNENIEAIPRDDLQKLADENPYFPVAQLLLAKKLKAENDAAFLIQAQKTALYFSNPYWLHHQLTSESWQDAVLEHDFDDKEIATKDDTANSSVKEAPGTHLSVNELQTDSRITDGNNWRPNEKGELPVNEAGQDNPENNTLSTGDSYFAEDFIEKAGQPEEEMAAITRDTDAATEEFLNEADADEVTFVRDNIEQVIMGPEIDDRIETIEVSEEMAGVSRETDQATESFLNEVSVADKPELSPAEIATRHIQAPNASPVLDIEPKNNKDESEPDEHERMFRNIKAMLDSTSEEAEADIKDTVIPIDPYYTIDYFASQGIKLDLDQNPKDQLGQNLKKFTDWLKHMKKLGPEDATEVIARTHTEADIQKFAETSNTVREVVTEAMAAVLEKQGKNEKAIELYKKLSFLNPHKSAYFADKIKNLKGI